MRATVTRIVTDDAGGTRFEVAVVDLQRAEFAPPAPPMFVSPPDPASTVRFIGAEAGWDSPPHPAPRRQYVVMLRGDVRATTSDGETRTFAPGDVVLLEDLEGGGHRTLVPASSDWLALVVALD